MMWAAYSQRWLGDRSKKRVDSFTARVLSGVEMRGERPGTSAAMLDAEGVQLPMGRMNSMPTAKGCY